MPTKQNAIDMIPVSENRFLSSLVLPFTGKFDC